MSEESLDFEYLILALGSTYPHPFQSSIYERKDQINHVQDCFNKVQLAKRILVIGGGAVGVELAGELATDYADKHVTLITTAPRLFLRMSDSFSRKSLSILRSKNVEVILNDKIDTSQLENFKNFKLKTQNGRDIEFDAFFVCIGGKPNTDLIKSTHPDWVDDKGYIKVNSRLNLEGSNNIFVIGDCCNINEEKMALKCKDHADVVMHNISQLLSKGNKFKEYKASQKIMMIASIGRNNGVFQIGPFTFSGCLPTLIKSKTLFIPRYKSVLGIKN